MSYMITTKKISKPILIYVDSVSRDLLVATILKNVLEDKQFKVFLVSRTTYKLLVKIIKPQVYIVIKNFLKNFEEDLIPYLKKTDVLIIDAEGAMTEERCEYHFTHFGIKLDKTLDIIKRAYLWNENFSSFLKKKLNISNKNVSVMGSPKLSLAKYYSSPLSKLNVIGFVGRFSATNDFMQRTALFTTLERKIKNDLYSDGAIGELNVLNVYLRTIDKLIKNTNLKISIRPHPNEKFDSWNILKEKYGQRIDISGNDEDFLEWMKRVDKIVATPSTSIIEPLILNKPVICVDKVTGGSGLNKYFEEMLDGFLDSTVRPDNENELFQKIISDEIIIKKKTDSFYKSIKEYYNVTNISGNECIENISLDLINEYTPSALHNLLAIVYFIPFYFYNCFVWLKIYIRQKNEFFYHYNYMNDKFSSDRLITSKSVLERVKNLKHDK